MITIAPEDELPTYRDTFEHLIRSVRLARDSCRRHRPAPVPHALTTYALAL